jgi:hypothetical protein
MELPINGFCFLFFCFLFFSHWKSEGDLHAFLLLVICKDQVLEVWSIRGVGGAQKSRQHREGADCCNRGEIIC